MAKKNGAENGMLTDRELRGLDSVNVFSGTRDEPVLDGVASILDVLQGDRMGVHAVVQFEDDSRIETRWVFAQK